MCHRVSPLVIEELRKALGELYATGHARVPERDPSLVVPDAYPGKQLPLFVPDDQGRLQPALRTWGFEGVVAGKPKLVFNTRIETALSQARSGRGMWAASITGGRCLVPVRGFYELWTRSPERRNAQVRFTYPRHQVFLLAGVQEDDRVSIVTTEPNASVAPVHSRMPLVLGPGESSVWLGPDFAMLADRSAIVLEAAPEDEPPERRAQASLRI